MRGHELSGGSKVWCVIELRDSPFPTRPSGEFIDDAALQKSRLVLAFMRIYFRVSMIHR